MKCFIFILAVLLFAFSFGHACAQTVTYTHNLSWQDNSDNEDGFKIERKTPSIPGDVFGEINTLGPNVVTYQDVVSTGLKRC